MGRLYLFVTCSLLAQTLQNGDYLGTVQIGVTPLRMALHLAANPDGTLSGTIDSIDQGALGMPIRNLTVASGVVRFGNFEGTLNADGSEISGRLMQGGVAVPIVFRKVAKIEGLARPQLPRKPYPYNEEEVEFENKAAGVRIAGTLTWPKGEGSFAAAVLLTGSGPQDRDSTMFGHKPFLVLADDLTRRGFAVLRMDDRGVGKSTGNVARSTLEDLARDAELAVEFLRSRKEINPKAIGFVGHSEGGYVAPMAAGRANAAFVVLLAGPGVPGEDLLYEQGQAVLRAVNAPPNVLERQSQLQHLMIGAVLAERSDPAKLEARLRGAAGEFKASLSASELAATPGFDQQLEGEIRRRMVTELQSLVRHDPRPYLRALKCPVLAMLGTLDTQVPAKQNLPAIAAALSQGSADDYSVVSLPGLNHLFQTAGTGAVAEFAVIEETIAPVALETLGAWLKGHFASTASRVP